MATITTRVGKGSALTHVELDANFTNLNDDKVEASGDSITGNLSFGDDNKLILGDGSDLEIYHNGSTSFIEEKGTGNLVIRGSSEVGIQSTSGTSLAVFNDSTGGVKLNYAGTGTVFGTNSAGVYVYGIVDSNGLTVKTSGFTPKDQFKVAETSGDVEFYNAAGTSADLKWDNSESDLIFADGAKAVFGTGSDLEIFHSGAVSFIEDNGTGGLVLETNGPNIKLRGGAGNSDMAIFTSGGSVELYNNNVKKLETSSAGVTVTGTVSATGGDSSNWNTAYGWGDHGDEGYLTDVAFSDIQAGSVLLSTETFSDVDTQLMTAAAIDDRILSYGYTTNVGDITSVQVSSTDGSISGAGTGSSGAVSFDLEVATIDGGTY